MARILGGFSSYSADEITPLLSSMRTLIVKTIELTLLLPVKEQQVHPPTPYGLFSDLVDFLLKKASPKRSVAVITFNYDLATDYAFHYSGVPFTYCLESAVAADAVRLLKLHGSLNWALCEGCAKVVPWELRDHFSKYHWRLEPGPGEVQLQIGSKLDTFDHCNRTVKPEPVIVPPTWNKTEHHRNLSGVWSQAAKELGQAQDIFVMGYSLPETDFFFRYLYALGSIGPAILRRFWVFNPDQFVHQRFKDLLGPGAVQRFQPFGDKFEGAIKLVHDECAKQSRRK